MSRRNHERRHCEAERKHSHFGSLECVLDRYQYENQMLNEKVVQLLEENRRLKMISTYTQPVQFNESQQKLQRSLKQECWKLRNFNEMNDYNLQNNTCSTQYRCKYEESPTPINSKGYQQHNIHRSPQIQRHNSESSEGYQLNDSNQNRLGEFQISQVDESSDTETTAYGQKLKMKKSQRMKNFTKQVYLELETAREEQQCKIPPYLEASFGQTYHPAEINGSQILQINKIELKQQKKVDRTPKRGKIEGKQKYQHSYRISRDQLNQNHKNKNNEKQNIQFINTKKTNQPYIKFDYKITEPKTKLTGIFQYHMDNEQENKPMIPNKSFPKRSFLSIMSKNEKNNILH